MGALYLGVQRGAAGFRRRVAIKRPHPHLLADETFRKMIVDEATHASIVRHPHVVSVDDVECLDGETLLVMNYVEGGSLSQLVSARAPLPAPIALRIAADIALALDAIHGAKSEEGAPLFLVHRDVSPQNILVGIDGVARLTDFGVATSRAATPTAAALRGKVGYLAPECIADGAYGAATDIYALGVVLWECLTGARLFRSDTDVDSLRLASMARVRKPSAYVDELGIAIDDVVLRALARIPSDRFRTAAAFSEALELAGELASRTEVGEFVQSVCGPEVERRRRELRALEEEETPFPLLRKKSDAKAPTSEGHLHAAFRLPDAEATRSATPLALADAAARTGDEGAYASLTFTPGNVPSVAMKLPVGYTRGSQRPKAPRSKVRVAAAVVFAAGVLAATAFLSYAGLSEDGPHATTTTSATMH